MDYKSLINKIFEYGKKSGFLDMEVYISNNKKLSIKVFDNEIDRYSIAEEHGLSFRGLFNGKMGYSYTEKIDESSIEILLIEAKGNAVIIDSLDEEKIFEWSKEYKEVKSSCNSFCFSFDFYNHTIMETH